MPEKEKCDPVQEALEVANKTVSRINQKSAADRAERTVHALRTGAATPEKLRISRKHGEERRDDEHVETENRERTAWRERCFVAILTKLEEKGITLPEKTKIILAEVMAKTPGEWNQYNGDPEGVDLGKIDFDPATQTITIRFEHCGEMIGKRIITLRL